jgi:hypothetical protein
MDAHAVWLQLLGISAIVSGLLAGASFDQSIEQLPARHRIGVRAYRAYSNASHMANGRFWLIPLGLLGPALAVVAAVWGVALGLIPERALPVDLAAALGIAHLISTAVAGRINWTIAPWSAEGDSADETTLARIFDRFERAQAVRAALQLATFVAAVLGAGRERGPTDQLTIVARAALRWPSLTQRTGAIGPERIGPVPDGHVSLT